MPEATIRSPLLATPARKTSTPDTLSQSIRRNEILDRLSEAQRRVTVIQAAAGSGKTVLAAQLAHEQPHPIVWVTLDPTDSDPVVLISSVMDALSRGGLDGGWGDAPLTSDDPTYTRVVVPHFRIRLEAQPRPVTLVLDDAHEVSSPAALGLLRTAVDSLPAGSHVIVAGRNLNNLPLASWLSSGQAALVTDADLAMDAGEVTEFVAQFGSTPGATAVQQLLESTRGWPIAVYLGSRLGDPSRLGDLTYFGAFLDNEVLRDADEETIRFLTQTSPLVELSADLCDYVLEQNRSGALLMRADAASLLVTRSSNQAWFRLHPLLREHLQRRLQGERPSQYRAVTHRAAEWSLTAGYVDRAIAYAHESGDLALLGTTTWEGATQALITGQVQRVITWLEGVDDVTIGRSCALSLTATWCAIYRGHAADAHRWGQSVFANVYEGWEAQLDRSSVEAGLALLLSTNGALGFERSSALAADAMRSLPGDHVVRPFAQMLTGWMQALGGPTDVGIENLNQSLLLAQSEGLVGTEVETKALLATVLLSRRDIATADRLVREALQTWEERGLTHFLASGALLSGPAAFLAARSGEDAQAAQRLRQAHEAVLTFGPVFPWLNVISHAFSAAAQAILGDRIQAGHHLEAAMAAARGLDTSPLLADLVAMAHETVEGEFRLAHLSQAERRVFERLLTRATLREIADSLFVSPETIKTQTGSIYRKLGVSSRRDLQELGEPLFAARLLAPGAHRSTPRRSP